MFGIFKRRKINWPQAGGAFDLDFPSLCAIIARGDRCAEATRDGSGHGEVEYHLIRAVNDIVFTSAEQIAETRTICQMMNVSYEMKRDLFHPFVLNYISGLSSWVYENRIPNNIHSYLKNAENGLINSSLKLLYGRNDSKARSVLDQFYCLEDAFNIGYEDGSVLIPRMRDEKKTDGVKRLAIFLFQ